MATLDISQCKINSFQALLKSFMLSVANSLWYDSDGGINSIKYKDEWLLCVVVENRALHSEVQSPLI